MQFGWASHPERIAGDFRIVREIGRGGMGIVFEAVQESLAAELPSRYFLHIDARLQTTTAIQAGIAGIFASCTTAT
ncbi:MAG: hypothetical protein U0930_07740 [Pirellulales bacterium]